MTLEVNQELKPDNKQGGMTLQQFMEQVIEGQPSSAFVLDGGVVRLVKWDGEGGFSTPRCVYEI